MACPGALLEFTLDVDSRRQSCGKKKGCVCVCAYVSVSVCAHACAGACMHRISRIIYCGRCFRMHCVRLLLCMCVCSVCMCMHVRVRVQTRVQEAECAYFRYWPALGVRPPWAAGLVGSLFGPPGLRWSWATSSWAGLPVRSVVGLQFGLRPPSFGRLDSGGWPGLVLASRELGTDLSVQPEGQS